MKRTKLRDRVLPDYTRGEEIMNTVTHIVGGVLSVAALVLCVVFAALHHNVYGIVSSSVYGASMIALYTVSSVYHGMSLLHFFLRKNKYVSSDCMRSK